MGHEVISEAERGLLLGEAWESRPCLLGLRGLGLVRGAGPPRLLGRLTRTLMGICSQEAWV